MVKSHYTHDFLFGSDLNDLERREVGLAILGDLYDAIDDAIDDAMTSAEEKLEART